MKFQSSPRRFAFAAIALCAIAALPAVGQVINEDFKVIPDDGAELDKFGSSVAISGNAAVVGAPEDDDNGNRSGAVYHFDITTGQLVTKLYPTDAASQQYFGNSVAISDNVILVGAFWDTHNGFGSGAAYLFDAETGLQTAKLLPSDGAFSDFFGVSVGISGNKIIIGAYQDDDNSFESGSAYIFDTTTRLQTAKLLPNDGAFLDEFGFSVAISGTTAVVGAHKNDDNGDESGSAYLFDAISGQQLAKLLPSDGSADDQFGRSVAIDGHTVVVGAWRDDDIGTNSGSAYIFDASTGQQIAKLLPDEIDGVSEFGHTVAISGNLIIVGNQWDDDNGMWSGSAYLFNATTGKQIAKLLPDDGMAGDHFGFSVTLSENKALIGSYLDTENEVRSGSAYIFTATMCPADLTGDATLNSADVIAFLVEYIAQGPTADFNADGVFNFFDVSAFLVAYLAGCP